MKKQEVRITYDNGKKEVFFFEHSFKSALEHAHEYIVRNQGKIKMKLYRLNTSNVGKKWIFVADY